MRKTAFASAVRHRGPRAVHAHHRHQRVRVGVRHRRDRPRPRRHVPARRPRHQLLAGLPPSAPEPPRASVGGGRVEYLSPRHRQTDGRSRSCSTPCDRAADGTAVLTYEGGMRRVLRRRRQRGDPQRRLVHQHGDSRPATTTPIPGTGETGPHGHRRRRRDGAARAPDARQDHRPALVGGVCGTDGTGYGEPSSFAPPRRGSARATSSASSCASTSTRPEDAQPGGHRLPPRRDGVRRRQRGRHHATSEHRRSRGQAADSLTGPSGRRGERAATSTSAPSSSGCSPCASTDAARSARRRPRQRHEAAGEDSSGRGRSYRDQVDFTIVPAAPVRVVKGVESVDAPAAGPNGVNPTSTGSRCAKGRSSGSGSTSPTTACPAHAYAAGGFDVWDVLPEDIRCAPSAASRAGSASTRRSSRHHAAPIRATRATPRSPTHVAQRDPLGRTPGPRRCHGGAGHRAGRDLDLHATT